MKRLVWTFSPINARPPSRAREVAERIRLRTLILLGGLAVGTAYLGRTFGLRDPIYLTSEVTLLLAILIVTHSVLPFIHRQEQGAAGEELVGRLLEDLKRSGYLVFHDVDLGRGNVDHVLIGPGGVFSVETKSHPGPIAVRRIHGAVFEQVRGQQQLLERAVGERVQTLLVYSQAWVDRPFARRRGVVVLPARLLPQYVASRQPVLGEAEVRRFAQRLRRAAGQPRRRRWRLRDRSLFFPPGLHPRAR